MHNRVVGGLVLGAAVAAGVWVGSRLAPASRPKLVPLAAAARGRPPESLLCGPRSLWIASMRLGRPLDWNGLLAATRFTPEGTTLGELGRVAESMGLSARVERLDWDRLRAAGTTAVVHVGGDHFVAVDPREADPGTEGPDAGDPRVRVYDPDRDARWLGRDTLGADWPAASLTLAAPPEGGPVVAWETCYLDLGYRHRYDPAEYTFRCRNTGDRPVTLEVVSQSCNCTAPVLGRERLGPGESTEVRATVDIRHKRGHYSETVEVRAGGEGDRPVKLVLAGGVYIDTVASTDAVHFEPTPPGGSTSQRFFLHDPGDGALRVRGVSTSWGPAAATEPAQGPRPEAVATFERVGQGGPLVGASGRYPVVAGDYVVDVTLRVPRGVAPGAFAGDLFVETGLPGDRARLRIPLRGTVLPALVVRPKAVLMNAAEPATHKVRLRLTGHNGPCPPVKRVVAERGAPLEVEGLVEDPGGGVYAVTVRLRPGARVPTAAPAEYSLAIELDGGETIRVPVLVVGQ